ncbi:MAG: LysM peptidoglycan-binding domain-containing protein [Halomonas sp.]
MAQRPVAGQGRRALALLLIALLLAGCASRPDEGTTRDPEAAVRSGSWIEVQRGDTLGALARRGGVPLERLQRFNPGVDADHLAVGQRLLMPTGRERAPSGGPYRYQVRPGDTYSSIARRFETRASRIQSANPGIEPNRLAVGRIIQVPLRDDTRSSDSGSTRQKAAAPSAPAKAPARETRPENNDLPASARGWPWPLEDYRVARAYGTDSRGTLQPMLLATDEGAQARAVADGEVRYAGSMRQLGQVVIVHHADNLQSVYALCERLLVEDGSKVKRGAPLCEVGYSNASERHDLLFDLRRGGKPLDPKRVLR